MPSLHPLQGEEGLRDLGTEQDGVEGTHQTPVPQTGGEDGLLGPRHHVLRDDAVHLALRGAELVRPDERGPTAQSLRRVWHRLVSYCSSPTASDGTSKAFNVKDTAVNQPMRTVRSTIPASPMRALARL